MSFKKLLICLILVLPVSLSAGILTVDTGTEQSFLDYPDGEYEAFTLPVMGISIGGKEPGWHFRLRLHVANRDFKLPMPSPEYKQDHSSYLRGVLGVQWIYDSLWNTGIYPFWYAGIQYRISEVKMKYTGYTNYEYAYGYLRFKRVSIPISAGFFTYLNDFLVLSLEGEADVIPVYSSYTTELFHNSSVVADISESKWFNEYNFSLMFQVGIAY
jgi:hypothetical protein